MSFKVEIKNIGKLADAELRIGRFTVFAGPNNSGKSFVSKLLYSFFDAMNAYPVETYMGLLISPLKSALLVLKPWIEEDRAVETATAIPLAKIEDGVSRLEALVAGASIEKLDQIIPLLITQTKQLQEMTADILEPLLKEMDKQSRSDFGDDRNSSRETATKTESKDSDNVTRNLFSRLGEKLRQESEKTFLVGAVFLKIRDCLAELHETFSQANATNFVMASIQHKIRQNLIQNFQVPRLSDLRNEETASSQVSVEDFGSFEFSHGEIKFNSDVSWKNQLQQYSGVIYLESPVYWKLKNALEEIYQSIGLFGRVERERLTGVPGYFYDLARALKIKYIGEIAFPDVYERLTGSNVIGGKLAISETGDLSFHENGRSFSLPVTAMGIANLGILALLIERKVLDEGSFLFIDEPEAHLHPAWQVIMAETLFELSRQGVNVVIATHSADILKWLEVHVKKNPDDERLVALNQFPVNGREIDEDFETRMAKIKQELTKPFSDLYLEGLL